MGEIAGMVEQQSRVIHQPLAGRGQCHAFGEMADEYLDAEFRLQLADRGRDRGLGDIQPLGRLRHAARVGRLNHVTQRPEREPHRIFLCISKHKNIFLMIGAPAPCRPVEQEPMNDPHG